MAAESMIERVARALADNHEAPLQYQARAAIEAMREPTPEMDAIGRDHNFNRYATPAWQAMIDAALNEQVSG